MDVGKLFGSLFKRPMPRKTKLKLIVAVGILGMALILLSQFMGRERAPQTPPDDITASFIAQEYAAGLETRLEQLLSGIEGVGRADVMVTLEGGVEYVYAQEETRGNDTVRQPAGSQTGEEEAVTVSSRENVEQRYIIVETEYGKREALVLTEREPSVRGVVVVCDGADDIRVQQKLTTVVTTALGIPSTRVCVVKIS